ncbi:GTP cyclohydrolase I FolE2 (plasmid) [Paracoccus liaowanqingii]|uniref:GTP cyclohydrolase I FolE2 n=1 Tax=Paracoccus liaowanqingii TaxID=2560053 RepID=A0A4Y5SUU2_9RHOB|nr:GTP cyclohydrolase FolE2 [Paracoccus liaowanqingii]QDA36514.1 GTP cyclohydrolase I FolE2 [Paracoccus liaowanqingii]
MQAKILPTRKSAEAALEVLRIYTETATDDDLNQLELSKIHPALSRVYPEEFKPDPKYLTGLPDLQNGPSSLIVGAKTAIHHVGISNFRLPIRYRRKNGSDIEIETSVTGTVSLAAEKKGINMSRIMRSFYAHASYGHSLEVIEKAIDSYKDDIDSFDARIQLSFSFPMQIKSLRSNLVGWQYYDISLELVDFAGLRKKMIHLDYVYSSTCPCSLELSEHARQTRQQLATPHSQRSVARLSLELSREQLWFEDLVQMARLAVPTETQVMVKREDEQAFAELNAAHPIFVEDAARSFYSVLELDPRVKDFRVVASHQESLHSHDAVSILTKGQTFVQESLDPKLFSTLVLRK